MRLEPTAIAPGLAAVSTPIFTGVERRDDGRAWAIYAAGPTRYYVGHVRVPRLVFRAVWAIYRWFA